MVNSIRSAAVAATALLAGGGAALAEGDLFIRELMLTPEQVARHAPRPADPMALEEALAAAVMREGNARRAEVGLSALAPDPDLANVARRFSQKMRDMAFFSHDAPDGEGLSRRLPEDMKYRYARLGENLWSGKGALDWRAGSLSAQATEDWILSPSHRDNLLEPIYDVAGVGVAVDTDQVFITMLYGKPQIDAASARLGAIYGSPPPDLYGLIRDLERAGLQSLNMARSEAALVSLAKDPALSREARLHAEATLSAGGMGAAAAEGEAVLRRVLDDPANRTSRLTMLVWEATSGVVWQGGALARAALDSWQRQGASMEDVLTPAYVRAGLGAATDGTRVFLSVLLSETSDPVVQVISQGPYIQVPDAGTPPLVQAAPYVQLPAAPVPATVTFMETTPVEAVTQTIPFVDMTTGNTMDVPAAQVLTGGAPLSSLNGDTLSTTTGGRFVTVE